ncbi:MAG: glycosyltransferase family 4 protein [Candidatus Krumholzibacteriota bacterium]|nr:glycosyltransferase family 4 protein [Candidatus Krumholzibacteriota bacterium]
MRVLFLTKYTAAGPSSRYRVYQYIPHLERAGVVCETAPLFDDRWLAALYGERRRPAAAGALLRRLGAVAGARRRDVVFVQKELAPWMPPLLEWALRRSGARVVYDIDDAIWLPYASSRRRIVRALLGDKIRRAIAGSCAVLAGNAFLAEYARAHNPETILVPTVVDVDRYRPAAPTEATPLVGWIGSPETAPFLDGVVDALRAAAAIRPFRLLVIGAPGFAAPGLDVEAVSWSEEREAAELARCSVGIMPLPDTPWARGKCGLKLLQYLAAGLPVVSSPHGGAADILEDGVDGLIARDGRGWTEGLVQILGDADLARRIGRAGRQTVETRFSLGVWAPRMLAVLETVAAGGRVSGLSW